jgi:hypothetical protein
VGFKLTTLVGIGLFALDIEMLTGLINDTSNIDQKVFVGEGITNVKV